MAAIIKYVAQTAHFPCSHKQQKRTNYSDIINKISAIAEMAAQSCTTRCVLNTGVSLCAM